MPSHTRSIRAVIAGGSALSLVAGLFFATAVLATQRRHSTCDQRVLVVSAMPIELSPLLSQEKVTRTVTRGGRQFFVGTLRGHDVILAMTRIGPVNATKTSKLALQTFRCGGAPAISAAVFSGVAGGDYIGDVAVPTRWTLDNGKSWLPVDDGMLTAARKVANANIKLERKTGTGDPLCTCAVNPNTVTTVAVLHKPVVKVGGNGQTTDPFGGRAIPCVPGNGDVFGCAPCPAAKHNLSDVKAFPKGIEPFVGTGFFTGYLQSPAKSDTKYTAQDEETAAVDKVMTAAGVPFIGFRAASDGTGTEGGKVPAGGDPLHLPGFPFQFFYYRQLASDNAALTTLAFLKTWQG
jgi:nucleoside phosphorylase